MATKIMKRFLGIHTTLYILLPAGVFAGLCYKDSDCPKPNMACRINSTDSTPSTTTPPGGVCHCRAGFVAWKWACHPQGKLGDPCVTSLQCQHMESRSICNPINHRCSCSRGHSPTRATPTTILLNSTGSDHQHSLVCVPDKVSDSGEHAAEILPVFVEDKRLARARYPPGKIKEALERAVHNSMANSPDHTNSETIFLAVMVLLGIGIAVVATLLYVKAIQEKKLSQAAVRSLLTLISENEGLKPSLTSDSLKTHNTEDGGGSREDIRSQNGLKGEENSLEDQEVHYPGYNTFRGGHHSAGEVDGYLENSVPDVGHILPSKITLAPMEEGTIVRFPAPHLSHPTLPPIRGGNSTTRATPHKTTPLDSTDYEEMKKTTQKYDRDVTGGFEDDFCPPRVPLQLLDPKSLIFYSTQTDKEPLPTSAASFPEDEPPSYRDLLR